MKANGVNITVLALSVLFALQSTASALSTNCELVRHADYYGGYPITGAMSLVQLKFIG